DYLKKQKDPAPAFQGECLERIGVQSIGNQIALQIPGAKGAFIYTVDDRMEFSGTIQTPDNLQFYGKNDWDNKVAPGFNAITWSAGDGQTKRVIRLSPQNNHLFSEASNGSWWFSMDSSVLARVFGMNQGKPNLVESPQTGHYLLGCQPKFTHQEGVVVDGSG